MVKNGDELLIILIMVMNDSLSLSLHRHLGRSAVKGWLMINNGDLWFVVNDGD